jgi:hypothetical protein
MIFIPRQLQKPRRHSLGARGSILYFYYIKEKGSPMGTPLKVACTFLTSVRTTHDTVEHVAEQIIVISHSIVIT